MVNDGTTPTTDHELAVALARAAGELLVDLRAELVATTSRERGQEGDRRSGELLVRELVRQRPGDGLLAEGAADDERRLSNDRVWIVDPLDGTREFGELGREDWAVHVALWAGERLAAGAVALPARGEVFGTQAPAEPPANGFARLRVAVSRSRPPAEAERLAAALGAELVPMGSAGFKAMAVVHGEVDAYVHSGGQYEWDSAAPAAIALASGLHASRLDGSPLRYNRPDPYLPDLIVCRAAIADEMLSVISDGRD